MFKPAYSNLTGNRLKEAGLASYVGTVNLDARSFYLNLKVTFALYNHGDSAAVSKIIGNYISENHRIETSVWMDEKNQNLPCF